MIASFLVLLLVMVSRAGAPPSHSCCRDTATSPPYTLFLVACLLRPPRLAIRTPTTPSAELLAPRRVLVVVAAQWWRWGLMVVRNYQIMVSSF